MMQAGPSQDNWNHSDPMNQRLDDLTQRKLTATYKCMRRHVKDFMELLKSPETLEFSEEFLLIEASKLGNFHEEINRALNTLNLGYLEFLSSRSLTPTVFKYQTFMDSKVPSTEKNFQEFSMKTMMTKDMLNHFILLMNRRIVIKDGHQMLGELERAMNILNMVAEAIDDTVFKASFISECHYAEVTVASQCTQKGNYYDEKRQELALPKIRDFAQVAYAERVARNMKDQQEKEAQEKEMMAHQKTPCLDQQSSSENSSPEIVPLPARVIKPLIYDNTSYKNNIMNRKRPIDA